MTPVALVDDHVLLRQGLANLVSTFDNYKVIMQSDNGKDFIEQLRTGPKPVVVLLDINMPGMNGFETAAWLKENHPSIKVLALSMSDEEDIVIKMLQSGAHGYILKNSTPQELREALDAVISKGYYINELVGNNLISNIGSPRHERPFDLSILNDKELQFIQLSCTELSYKEIAAKMFLSVKTIEFYKNNVEKKTGIKNRIALFRFALKHQIVKL